MAIQGAVSAAMMDIFSSMPFLWRGLFVTIEISALVILLSLAAGLLLGVIVTYGPLPARLVIHLFSDVIRGIPILVLIFAVYYGLPVTGLNLNNFTSAVIALALFSTAQIIEIARGALQSIHHGQTEAAKAIGLTFTQRLAYVIFPQALRRFLPPWINSVTDIVKGSALVSLVGVVDLMLAIQQVIGRTYVPMPLYVLGALIYFAINYTLSSLSRMLEARYAYIRE
jgi:polar amino acid transport system permease protein